MFLAVWCSRCGKTVRIHERNCHPPAASHNMSCNYSLTTTTITTTIMDSNTHYFNYQTSDIFNRRYGGIPPHTNGFWWPQDTTFSSFMSNSIICLAASSSSLPMSLLLLPQPIHPPTNDLLGRPNRDHNNRCSTMDVVAYPPANLLIPSVHIHLSSQPDLVISPESTSTEEARASSSTLFIHLTPT